MQWDVIVIGAGPAGCFTAAKIARAGFKTLVIEEHSEIGRPVQCAGLISPRALELSGADDSVVINRLKGLLVLSPLGAGLQVESENDIALAIDRSSFDRNLAENAQEAGAIFLKGMRTERIEPEKDGFLVHVSGIENHSAFKTKLLIGADGANSSVAEWLRLERSAYKAVMYSAEAEMKNRDPGLISIFLGRNLAPGWFGWIIPLDEKACRVGTGYALMKPDASPRQYFQHMTEVYPQFFKELKITKYTGGWVPLGRMPRIYAFHAMLVGDAACQVKPVSGGGIFMGLRGAHLCAQTAIEALSENNLSEEKLSSYQRRWEEDMREEIDCAMMLRQRFMDFGDEDIDLAIRLLSKPSFKELIIKNGDIDYPSQLAKKLLSLIPADGRALKSALKLAEKIRLI
ncbi:MAG: geranylgeranyl reductase family protein [Oscillospiraceae bacterium]|jgi:digeranylgeranylglycerophospholipid reductase